MDVKTGLSRASRSSKGLQDSLPILSCLVCDQSLDGKLEFDSHLEKHANETPSRCMLCSKVFKFRGTLTRHLFTEHGVSEPIRLGGCVPGDVVWGGVNKHKHSSEDSVGSKGEEDDDGISRMMEGFLPDGNKKSRSSEEPKASKPNNEGGGMDGSRSAATESDLKSPQMKSRGIGLSQCEFCKVLFATANSLQIHQKLNHARDVETSLAKSGHEGEDRNGDDNITERESPYEVKRVDIGGPSENIVSEPDFDLIKIAASSDHLNYDTSPDVSPSKDGNRVIEWNSGVFSVGHFVEEDDQEQILCVAPLNDSGTNVKYRLSPCSEEVLVTRVVGVNVSNGERAFLYKCHWCAEVFLALDRLQEHLGTHLRRSRKTFMCYSCGELFSTNNCLKLHLIKCQKDDDEEEQLREHVGKSSESNSPLDFTSTSSEGGVPLSAEGGVCMPCDVKIKVEPGLETLEGDCIPPCDVPIKLEPIDDGYDVAEPANNFLAFEPESEVKFDVLSVKTEPERIASPVDKKSALSPSESSPPTLLMTKDGTRVGYQCNYCPKLFDRLYSLNRHLRSHTGVKPCYCKECGKGFSEPRNLRHHIIRFHSDGSERHLLRRVRDRTSKGAKQKRGSAPSVSVTQGRGKSMSNAPCSELSTDDAANVCDSRKRRSGRTHRESVTTKLFETIPEKLRKLEEIMSAGGVFCSTGVSGCQSLNMNNSSTGNKFQETPDCTLQILSDPKLSLIGNLRKQRDNRSAVLNSIKTRSAKDVDLSPHLSALSSLSGELESRVMDPADGNMPTTNDDACGDVEKLCPPILGDVSGSEHGSRTVRRTICLLRSDVKDQSGTRSEAYKPEVVLNVEGTAT